MMRLISRVFSSLLLLFAASLLSLPDIGRLGPLSHLVESAYADISLAQAVELVKEKTGGRVLSSRELNAAAGKVFLVKVLLPSGQVTTYRVSAADGSIQ